MSLETCELCVKELRATPPTPDSAAGGARRIVRFNRVDGIACLAVLLVTAMFPRFASNARFDYDESDYMSAVRRGFLANYLDQPSISIFEFVSIGLRRGGERRNWDEMSQQIRESGDITFLRHFHGPAYWYWLMPVSAASQAEERAVRASGLVFHAALAITVYFLCLALSETRTAAALGASLVLLSPAVVLTSIGQASPHALYIWAGFAVLALLALYLKTRRRRYWYAMLAALGVSFCTIAFTIFLLPSIAAGLFLFRRELFSGWTRAESARFGARSAAVLAGTILLLWPMSVLKLNLVKSYAVLANLALRRKGAFEQETYGRLEVWWLRLARDPLEYALILAGAALILWIAWKAPGFRPAIPLLIYAAVMSVVTSSQPTMKPRYYATLLPPLHALAGISMAWLLRGRPPVQQWLAAGALVALLGWHTWSRLSSPELMPRPRPYPDAMDQLRAAGLDGKRVLVPWILRPALQYYFPGIRTWVYHPDQSAAEVVARRLRQQRLDGVVCLAADCAELAEIITGAKTASPSTVGFIPAPK